MWLMRPAQFLTSVWCSGDLCANMLNPRRMGRALANQRRVCWWLVRRFHVQMPRPGDRHWQFWSGRPSLAAPWQTAFSLARGPTARGGQPQSSALTLLERGCFSPPALHAADPGMASRSHSRIVATPPRARSQQPRYLPTQPFIHSPTRPDDLVGEEPTARNFAKDHVAVRRAASQWSATGGSLGG